MGLIEKYARGLSHEQLIEEYLRLTVRYDERGIAMVETGDMVRSLYIPQINKLREALEAATEVMIDCQNKKCFPRNVDIKDAQAALESESE